MLKIGKGFVRDAKLVAGWKGDRGRLVGDERRRFDGGDRRLAVDAGGRRVPMDGFKVCDWLGEVTVFEPIEAQKLSYPPAAAGVWSAPGAMLDGREVAR